MWYALSKFVIKVFGDIQFFPSPFFCLLWGSTNYKVRGDEARVVLGHLKAGDILLCRFDRYVSSWFIPGFWTHVALYVGDDKVIHARTKGVVEEDILTFLRTDYVSVMRLKVDDEARKRAIDVVRGLLGKEYDFLFETEDDERMYCSELVKYAYPGALDELNGGSIPPDKFFSIEEKDVIHDSREWRKED